MNIEVFRPGFESLEPRMALSASFGTMEAAPRYEAFALRDDGGRLQFETGMFAPQPRQHIDRHIAIGNELRDVRPHSSNGTPPIERYVVVIGVRPNGFQPLSQPPNWSPFLPINQEPPFDEQFSGAIKSELPRFATSPGALLPIFSSSGGGGVTNTLPSVSAPSAASREPVTSVAAIASSLTSLSAASNSDSRSAISAIAQDAAFQDYASQPTWIASGNTSSDLQKMTTGEASTSGDAEELRGFIRRHDDSSFDWLWSSSLEEERQAVDEVLRRLHDPDALRDRVSDDDGERDQTGANDSVGDDERFELDPWSNAAEGMILLQAEGDANESEINLMAVMDDGLEIADALAGVEASVGIHQAFDVAAEEGLPIRDVIPAVEKTAPESQKGAAAEHESSTLHRAAAAVGATALYGVILRKRRQPKL
jgi:hypothetical protein